jgi:hypothetical protein
MKDITEVDVIEFTDAVGKWPAGTRGTVVFDLGWAKAIEISDDQGQMLDLLDVEEDKLKLVIAYRGAGEPAA